MTNAAAVFFACNNSTGYLANFPTVECWVTPNNIYAIIGAILLVIQTILQIFATFALTDTSLGKTSSFFSINSFYFIVIENSTCLFIPAIYRLAFQSMHYMRPILVMIQALLSIFCLVMMVPFYKARANSLYSGLAFARFFGSILTLTSVFANPNNDQNTGIAFAVTLMCVFAIAFVVGVVAMEIYQFYVLRKCNQYDTILMEQDEQKIKTVKTRNLEIGLRLHSGKGEQQALKMEKIVKIAGLHAIETSELLLQQAVIHMYYSKATTYAALCLQKTLTYRPNFLNRFIIFLRQQDLEMVNSEQNNKRRITRLIDNGKRMENDLSYYQRQFWKNLVSKKSDLNALSNFAHLAYGAEKECDRIFTGLITKYPKNIQIVRVYAQYLENVQHKPEMAEGYYAEADSLEEQEVARTRQKRKELTEYQQLLEQQQQEEENEEEESSPSTGILEGRRSSPRAANLSSAPIGSTSEIQLTRRNDDSQFLSSPVPMKRAKSNTSVHNGALHRGSTAVTLKDDDNVSFIDSTAKNSVQMRNDSYHKQLMHKDNKYAIRVGVFTIMIAMFVTTLIVGSVIEARLKFSNTNIMVDGCRMGMLPMKVLDQWRHYQMDYAVKNYSSKLKNQKIKLL
jgi:hypothetical protein